jgi:hypothetical protein
MKNFRLYAVVWLTLFLSFVVNSFSYGQKKEANHFGFVKARKKSMSLPFKLVNNLVIIPIFINNSDTLHFILDTGVQSTLLTNLANNDSLVLSHIRKVQVKGLGAGMETEAYQSQGNIINIGDVRCENSEMLILTKDIFLLSTKLGTTVHGLIGYDVFKHFVVEIDYDNKILTLHNSEKYKRNKQKGTRLPITIENRKPYLQTNIVQDDSTKISVKLVIDTGASHSLSLEKTATSAIKIPKETIESYLGRGVSGDIRGKIGRIASLDLAGFKFYDLPASYPDEMYIKNVVGVAQRHGNLGAEVLRRFHVIFDYANNEMIIKPAKKFKEPFNYNMSGIDVGTPLPGLPYYVIADISAHSPAEVAGLQKDDQILYINGRNAADYSLNDIIELFQSKVGKKITLTVMRETKTVKATLVLKRPI